MKRALWIISLISPLCFADSSVYCPAGAQSIQVGASIDQVIQACGQPISQQVSNDPITQQIPMTQLLYNSVKVSAPFQFRAGLSNIYNTYTLPTNQNAVRFEVDVVNNQVYAIRMNGTGTNGLSICGGVQIQKGDPVGKVYGACGNPDSINQSFIDQPIQTQSKPQKWVYQFSPYQPAVTFTVVDGKLQAIN